MTHLDTLQSQSHRDDWRQGLQKPVESYPGLIETGFFNMYVQVTETGISQTSEFYYDREGLNDWFDQTIIKLMMGLF